jgi:hypothetical protein
MPPPTSSTPTSGWAQSVEAGPDRWHRASGPEAEAALRRQGEAPSLGRKRSLFQRFGLSLVDETLGAVEDRALWARYGL